MFLENGNRVFGVEPNEAMREAAEEYLARISEFHQPSTARRRTRRCPTHSVDFVIAAQAFHWFDAENTRNEFRRILKPGG